MVVRRLSGLLWSLSPSPEAVGARRRRAARSLPWTDRGGPGARATPQFFRVASRRVRDAPPVHWRLCSFASHVPIGDPAGALPPHLVPANLFCANVLPAVPADGGPGEYSAGDGGLPAPAATRDRLKARRPFWASCACASLVLTWIVTGYNLQWATDPPPPFEARNARGALEDEAFVDEAVQQLLQRGAVRRVAHRPRCVSPLNVATRRGKKRLILDLRRVNECLRRDGTGFKFADVHDASTVLQPQDFLFKVDLEAAYHHVAMHPDSWEYLGFRWRDQYYVFTVLPFGLATAPWVFTKVTRTLVGRWRALGIRLVHYLDDFLFAVAPDADGGHCDFDRVQRRVLADFAAAGFTLNPRKLALAPAHRLEFLGFTVDTVVGRISASAVRAAETADALRRLRALRRKAPLSLLATLTGKLVSLKPALGHAVRIFTRGLYHQLMEVPAQHWHRRHAPLSAGALAEVDFWARHFAQLDGQPIWAEAGVEESFVFSDASDSGWGGVFRRTPFDNAVAQGYFVPCERRQSSTWRELLVAEHTLRSFEHFLWGKMVTLYTNNQNLEWI